MIKKEKKASKESINDIRRRDAGHGLVSQYPDKFGKVITTFLQTFS